MNERETKFQGFAQAQMDDLESLFADLHYALSIHHFDRVRACQEAIETYIAKRAYDLAKYVAEEAPISEYEWSIADVADLTELPPL